MSEVMDLLRSVKDQTDETEFYTPLPDGYKLGATRYVAVFGTVMSGLGKGIFSSSLAKLLKDKGLRVSPIKLEGYLNIDSGTLNPFRHRFEVDRGYVKTLDRVGLVFSGKHPVHPIMQILELPRNIHPFLVAARFHPELTSRPLNPQPMFVGLAKASLEKHASQG